MDLARWIESFRYYIQGQVNACLYKEVGPESNISGSSFETLFVTRNKPYRSMEKSVLYAGAERKPFVRKFAIKNGTILDVICGLLILLFMYAGVSKLMEYETFKLQLSQSPFITEFADTIAWALPAGEIIVCACLAFKSTRVLGLYGSLFLMTMFTMYIYTMLNYSYYVPCSCGGLLSKMGWTAHFWFNVGFTLLSVAGIFISARKPPKKVEEEPPPVIFT